MVAARFALASARPALRRAAMPLPRLASGPTLARANSSSTSSHGAHTSSDTPWALTSAVVFGSLFFYLTSPASKTHNEHGHITGGHSPTTHGAGASVTDDKTGDDAVWKQDDEESARAHAEHIENEGKLTHAEDAPAGDKHLAQNSRTAPADQQKSPTNRDLSNSTVGIENSNFQHGVAHVKQGGESNPKEAVAAANADKQARKAEKESQQQGEAEVESQDKEESQDEDK